MASHRILALATALAGTTGGAEAEPLHLQRGVNGDLWNNWGSIAELQADP